MDLAKADIQHRLDKVEAEIDRRKLLVEQQAINVNELLCHPSEAKAARATLDRWVGELVGLRRLKLTLYQQLALAAHGNDRRAERGRVVHAGKRG